MSDFIDRPIIECQWSRGCGCSRPRAHGSSYCQEHALRARAKRQPVEPVFDAKMGLLGAAE